MKTCLKSASRLACVVTLILLSCEAARAGGPELDLQSAIRYAVEHSPLLSAARETSESSSLAVRNANSAFLPSLDFTTTDGYQGSSSPVIPGGSPWTGQGQVSLTENLYDNGTSIINRKSALYAETLAQLAERKTRDQLCLNIAQEFYQYSLLSELLAVKKQQSELVGTQYERIANQYRQGFSTRQDYLRFKTSVQRAQLDYFDTNTQLVQAVAQLQRYLSDGSEAKNPEAHPSGELRFQPQPIVELREPLPADPAPLEHSYEFKIAKAQRDSNQLAVELAERKYWPQLALSGGVNQAAYWNSPGQSGYSGNLLSWNALATLQFNLWDWGTRRRNVAIAELTADSQNDALSDGVLEIRRLAMSLNLEIKEFGETYKLTSELLKLSQQSFDLLDKQYRLGQVSYLDLITGLNDLLDAKVRFYTVHFQLLRDLAQFRFYDGTLYDFLLANAQH